VSIRVRGYCKGEFQVKTAWNGPVLGSIPVFNANIWTDFAADVAIPDGVHPLYFTYTGSGNASFASFTLS
jgi:hypothetical protein